MHHGGAFCTLTKQGIQRGKVNYFNYCSAEKISMIEIGKMIFQKLDYVGFISYQCLITGMDLNHGLRPL